MTSSDIAILIGRAFQALRARARVPVNRIVRDRVSVFDSYSEVESVVVSGRALVGSEPLQWAFSVRFEMIDRDAQGAKVASVKLRGERLGWSDELEAFA